MEAESFAAQRVQLGDDLDALRNSTIEAIERVAAKKLGYSFLGGSLKGTFQGTLKRIPSITPPKP